MWELALIPAGIASLVVAMMYWQRMQRWLVRAEFARAEIVRLEAPQPDQGALPADTDDRATVFPVVRFIDEDDRPHEKRLRVGLRYGRVKDRSNLDISYDPTDLDDVRLGVRRERILALAFGVAGIGLILWSVRGLLR